MLTQPFAYVRYKTLTDPSFIIVSGPFKRGSHQWPLEISRSNEIKDWTEQSIFIRFPSSKIKRFDVIAKTKDKKNMASFWTRKGFTDETFRLLDFVNKQRIAAPGRKVVFISAGLGGLLVKNALVKAFHTGSYSSIPELTQGLVFFATPHRTSALETWEDVIF